MCCARARWSQSLLDIPEAKHPFPGDREEAWLGFFFFSFFLLEEEPGRLFIDHCPQKHRVKREP